MVARPWHKAWRSSGSTPPERRAPNLVSFAADDPQAHASQATHRKTAPPDPGIPRASDRHSLSRRPQRNHVRPIAGKRFFSRLSYDTVRLERIAAAWAEQKIVGEIMVFLHSHGVGTARAIRIFKTYGVDAIEGSSKDGRRDLDQARNSEDCDSSFRTGISYALTKAMDEGHCGLPPTNWCHWQRSYWMRRRRSLKPRGAERRYGGR